MNTSVMATIADKVLLEHIRIQQVPHLTSMGCSGVASTNPRSQPARNCSSWCSKPNLQYIYIYMCVHVENIHIRPKYATHVYGFLWSPKNLNMYMFIHILFITYMYAPNAHMGFLGHHKSYTATTPFKNEKLDVYIMCRIFIYIYMCMYIYVYMYEGKLWGTQ